MKLHYDEKDLKINVQMFFEYMRNAGQKGGKEVKLEKGKDILFIDGG